MLVLAYRGGSGYATENTMAAFWLAYEMDPTSVSGRSWTQDSWSLYADDGRAVAPPFGPRRGPIQIRCKTPLVPTDAS
jgi:hypothetical protein